MSEREIRALDQRTVERIAAGEVVERPASVVKELVENSLDAGADRISVTVEAGGVDRIRVTDDGKGIPRSELRHAVEKHTTSKLADATDLAGGIRTLGFRGEALHTIGAVSRMTITSRPTANEGGRIEVVGGEVGAVAPAGCPVGTTVEVDDLFFNTPARRSFLGTTETEFDHVNRVVTEYALANPAVAFSLTHGDREVFATPGRGDLAETVMTVWGREVAESMDPLDGSDTEGPLERIRGMVSDPETTRSRPRYLATFVNGRAVRSTRIREGILDGYGDQLAPDRYPFAVLFCSIPPDAVDVNVHPRKTEVRFDEPADITAQISATVESHLLDAGLIRTTAARGRGAPEETTVRSFATDQPTPESSDVDRGVSRSTESTPQASTLAANRFVASTTQRSFDGAEPEPELESLPALRLLGQLAETYIVAEADGELVLIDQHAADERIHFERLRERFADRTLTQELVEPVEVPMTGDEAAAFAAVREALERLGFAAKLTGEDRTIRVTGVPTILDATVAPEALRDALAAVIADVDADATVEKIADALIGDMACRPAITGNEPMAEGPMIDLLEALDACENPYACPHGRPTIVRIDADELADRFERDYPGHATRRPLDS